MHITEDLIRVTHSHAHSADKSKENDKNTMSCNLWALEQLINSTSYTHFTLSIIDQA